MNLFHSPCSALKVHTNKTYKIIMSLHISYMPAMRQSDCKGFEEETLYRTSAGSNLSGHITSCLGCFAGPQRLMASYGWDLDFLVMSALLSPYLSVEWMYCLHHTYAQWDIMLQKSYPVAVELQKPEWDKRSHWGNLFWPLSNITSTLSLSIKVQQSLVCPESWQDSNTRCENANWADNKNCHKIN